MRSASLRLLLTALLLVGCSDDDGNDDGNDDGTGPQGTLAGSYILQTVNGIGLPATIIQGGAYRLQVTAGNVNVNSNNTFSATHTIRETDGGNVYTVTETCTGTVSQSGNSVTFSTPISGTICGGTYVATWSNGNTLTVAYDAGLQAVYRK